MQLLPTTDTKNLNLLVGAKINTIVLCYMKDCGEEYISDTKGFVETTWGITFDCNSNINLTFTCGEDSNFGDPFHISIVNWSKIKDYESLIPHDVSKLRPWSEFIGKTIGSYKI